MRWARDVAGQLSAISGHVRVEVDKGGVAWRVCIGPTVVIEGRGRGDPGPACERTSGVTALEMAAEVFGDWQRLVTKELARVARKERTPRG